MYTFVYILYAELSCHNSSNFVYEMYAKFCRNVNTCCIQFVYISCIHLVQFLFTKCMHDFFVGVIKLRNFDFEDN